MDSQLLLTLCGMVLAIIGTNIALIGWIRSDMKSFECRIYAWSEQLNRDMTSYKEEFKKDIASYKEEINKEMKDFHGRLCAIEERRKGK